MRSSTALRGLPPLPERNAHGQYLFWLTEAEANRPLP
jgi:hypothetical protein